MLRIGVIGCGYWAQRHLRAWRELHGSGAELVAVCDTDSVKLREAANRFAVPRQYENAGEMFSSGKIDVVDIATRMGTHRPLVEGAIAQGIAVVVQKPMAPTWNDCLAMADAARRANIFLAVHENFRFQPAMLKAAALLAVGCIGDPSWARISFRTGVDVYRNQPYFLDERRLVILDLGIHMLDLARVFLGEVHHLSCETQRRNPRVRAEDTATMVLRHLSGAVSVVECTYESRQPHEGTPEVLIQIEGNRGSITCRPGGRELLVTRDGSTARQTFAAPDDDILQASVQATCRHVLESFRFGRRADTDVEDNLKTYALVEAAYESAASGRSVQPASWAPHDG